MIVRKAKVGRKNTDDVGGLAVEEHGLFQREWESMVTGGAAGESSVGWMARWRAGGVRRMVSKLPLMRAVCTLIDSWGAARTP